MEVVGIAHVVLDGVAHLLLPLRRVDGFGSPLGNVGGSVEFAALAAVPQLIEAHAVGALQCMGDDGVATLYACESSGFGEAAELDGALPGSFYFVDGVGELVVLYEGFVGSVVEDDGFVLEGVVHPQGEFLFCHDGTCGVVGIAEEDDVEMS